MSKQHPQSVILIEPVNYKLWRVVERETTLNLYDAHEKQMAFNLAEIKL